MVTFIWNTWLNTGSEAEGLRLMRQMWPNLLGNNGYLSHQICIGQSDPKHLIAPGNWLSEVDMNAVLATNKNSETIKQLIPLLACHRERWLTTEDEAMS